MPFVSRGMLDALRRECGQWEASSHAWAKQCEGLLDAVQRKDEHIATLTDHILKLKLAGANEPAVIPPPPPHALAKYPKTRAALDAMGHGQQGSIRRAMTAEAVKMLTVEGLSDEYVAKAVTQGEPYQPREDIT